MLSVRRCSRTGCTELAVATLTYVADSTAVVGPLATQPEPHSLRPVHRARATASPRPAAGSRPVPGEVRPPQHSGEDLTALADAVRRRAG
ncbi:DUF3499 family protein [Pseudonocardia sp. MCCB 268]|nr:DUF3499 family protein [Pseudonocardia cytotoxica]